MKIQRRNQKINQREKEGENTRNKVIETLVFLLLIKFGYTNYIMPNIFFNVNDDRYSHGNNNKTIYYHSQSSTMVKNIS